jgi:hypothetical protein
VGRDWREGYRRLVGALFSILRQGTLTLAWQERIDAALRKKEEAMT